MSSTVWLICLSLQFGTCAVDPVAPPAPARPKLDHLGDALPGGAIARLGTHRFWHGHWIYSIAISLDGKLIASSGAYGPSEPFDGGFGPKSRICLCDAASGKLIREIDMSEKGAGDLTFSPDGRMLASSGWNEIRVFSVTNGEELYCVDDRGNALLAAVHFSMDSKQLITETGRASIFLPTPQAARGFEASMPGPERVRLLFRQSQLSISQMPLVILRRAIG